MNRNMNRLHELAIPPRDGTDASIITECNRAIAGVLRSVHARLPRLRTLQSYLGPPG
jgi:hypothetical protein